MIINCRDNFIFVHIGKTGGTCIKHLIANELNGINDIRSFKPGLEAHPTMSEIEDKTNLDKYFKFCFVRNPWDLVASKFFYHQRKFLTEKFGIKNPENDGPKFLDWYMRKDIKNDLKHEFKKWVLGDNEHRSIHKSFRSGFEKRNKKPFPEIEKDIVFSNATLQYEYPLANQIDYILSKNLDENGNKKILVDKIYRFENFKVDAFNCLKRIGVPHNPSIPKINASHRPEWFHSYRDIYTPRVVEFVRDFYRRDIEEFGYEY